MIKLSSLILTVLLMGCAASGPQYSSLDPDKSKATIVVYRIEPTSLMGYTVAINGEDVCNLHHEGYFSSNVNPGKTKVTTSFWSMPGTSHIELDTKAGKTYYVRVTHNTANSIAAMGGLMGQMAYQSASGEDGPMQFILQSKEIALEEIKETRLDCQ